MALKHKKNLAATLQTIQGRFMLSINDHPDIRKTFKAFTRKEVSLLYTIDQAGPTEAQELIYSNFQPKENVEQSLFPEDW